MTSDAEYFRHLGARCRRLAHSCFDLGTAGELREIADELDRKAEEAAARHQQPARETDERPNRQTRQGTGRAS